MFKTTIHVEGMMCPKCEKHAEDAVKSVMDVKSVKASHTDNKVEIVSKTEPDIEKIKGAIAEAGYKPGDIE